MSRAMLLDPGGASQSVRLLSIQPGTLAYRKWEVVRTVVPSELVIFEGNARLFEQRR